MGLGLWVMWQVPGHREHPGGSRSSWRCGVTVHVGTHVYLHFSEEPQCVTEVRVCIQSGQLSQGLLRPSGALMEGPLCSLPFLSLSSFFNGPED